jgi:protein PhnA
MEDLPHCRKCNSEHTYQDGLFLKDLKVKGSSTVVKVGTKVRNIRLVDGDHDIDCKIDGIGPMKLKSMYVKKS